jgi:hypothetical protein
MFEFGTVCNNHSYSRDDSDESTTVDRELLEILEMSQMRDVAQGGEQGAKFG